jgi:hypothetical protein
MISCCAVEKLSKRATVIMKITSSGIKAVKSVLSKTNNGIEYSKKKDEEISSSFLISSEKLSFLLKHIRRTLTRNEVYVWILPLQA